MSTNQERGNARSFAEGQVIKTAKISEIVALMGIYDAECLRPLPQFRNEAETLLQRRIELENSVRPSGKGWSVPQRPFHTVEELEELDEIAIRLRPMQEVIWRDRAINTVATVGKNLALDTFLAGSSYTVVGPYMGLISSVSWSATNAADTMSSHAGWTEAGNANAPTYSGTRKTAAWSAASAGSKALSSALAFTFTGSGTIKGCFLVYGTGAVNTIDNTSGTLMSAGVFSGGDKSVINTDVVNVSYSLAF